MRSFLAIDIPESFRAELVNTITDLQAQFSKTINWVQPENLHFTVQFLGEIHQHHLKEIKDFIEKELTQKKVILMHNPKLTIVPAKQPKIIWVEMDTEQTWVYQFIKRLRLFLQDLGYDIEKKKVHFHITLGRIKGNLPEYFIDYVLKKNISRISVKLNTITLYKSKLLPEGPIYEAISKFTLEENDEER